MQKTVLQPRISQQVGPVKIHAVGLPDLLHQQVAAVFGPPGLAQHDHLAMLHGDHRFDGQQSAHQSHGGGDSAAPLEILQGVQQGHQANILFLPLQLSGDGGGVQPLVQQVQSPPHQNLLADGGVFTVHHKDTARELLRRDAGALAGAGEFGGQHDGHHVLPLVHGPAKGLLKLGGVNLAGGGQGIPLNELLVELAVGQVHAVQELLLPKGHGHGQDCNLRAAGLGKVGGGIGNNAYLHSGSSI